MYILKIEPIPLFLIKHGITLLHSVFIYGMFYAVSQHVLETGLHF